MAVLERNSSTFTTGSSWSSESNALNDGAPGSAQTATPSAAVVYYGMDFSGLPSSITVVGISLRLDALKDETDGSGPMILEAELSWNSASSWTGSNHDTGALTTSEATYTLGGATDTWGRTWTRAELQANLFRVRITASSTGALIDDPEWLLEYLQITVHYTDTSGATLQWTESVELYDTEVHVSRLQLLWSETVAIRDEAPGLPSGRAPDGLFGGDVMDEIQSPPATILSATAQHNAPHGFGISLSLTGAAALTRTVVVGDPQIVAQGTGAQSGLVEMSDLTIEAAPAVPGTAPEMSFAIAHRPMGSGTTTDWITTFLRETYVLGQAVIATLWVLEGSTWTSKLVFWGSIISYEITPEVVRIRCADVVNDLVEAPLLIVHPQCMQYGSDEGTMPVESNGVVIPIAIGQFNAGACAVYTTGHPFEQSNEGLSVWAAPLVGIKTPMIPMVLVSDGFRRKAGDSDARTVRQLMFAFGDMNSPAIRMLPLTAGLRHLPVGSASFSDAVLRVYNSNLFTWNRELDRAESLQADESTDINTVERTLGGAGPYGEVIGAITGPAFPLQQAQGFYVNRTNPQFLTTETTWPGVLQSVYIPCSGLTDILVGSFSDGTPVGTLGTLNPLNAVDNDPNTFALLSPGNRLALQVRRNIASLGEVYLIRAVLILNTFNSSTLRYGVRFANSPTNPAVEPNYALVKPDMNATASGNQGQTTTAKYSVGYLFGIGKGSAAYGQWPQFKFVTSAFHPVVGGGGFEQAWDIQCWCTSGTARVVWMGLEVVYRSRIAGSLLGMNRTVERRGEMAVDPATGRGVPRGNLGQPGQPLEPTRTESISTNPAVFAACYRTVADDASGTYTGSANLTVENPADIVGLLISKYMPSSEFAQRAVSTAFGSFVTARTALNAKISGDTFRLSAVVDSKRTLRSIFDEIQEQSMSFFRRIPNDSGLPVWQAFVDGPSPQSETSRLFRTTGGLFEWLHIMHPEQLRIIPTPLDAIASNFVLNYGYHYPTRNYAYTKYVSPTGDNLESNGTAYRAACLATETRYGLKRQFSVAAPWVWSHKVADALVKWHCDNRRDRILTMEFYLPLAFIDLLPGHVIRFADSFASFIKYPGHLGATTWSTHYWNVLSVTVVKQQDLPIALRVIAREVYTAAA